MDRPQISVVAHNIRSAHNVGSIFRTCDGFGVEHLYLSGYTPYPLIDGDTRLPHISAKATTEIAKIALGAERSVAYSHIENISTTIDAFKAHGYLVVGLEQDADSTLLSEFRVPNKILLILGEELEGITPDIRKKCDQLIEIPMVGAKESFNVSVATGIALYGITYASRT